MENKREKISYHLKNLYLDPNNYRFIDNDNYKKVKGDKITDEIIQKRTRKFIEGKNQEGVKDLIASFKANGFLDIDLIQVKDLGENHYLVIEGNRRVTALKILLENYNNGIDIGNLNSEVFKKIPFEIYKNEDNLKHLIIMGLKHISGNKKWPAINQAKLIYDYLSKFKKNDLFTVYSEEENKLCESLGITKIKLRNSQRAYHLIKTYKESDYGDQFESNMYSIFEEITKRPSIKGWLGWNDKKYKAENRVNLERLFSWISKIDEREDEENFSIRESIIKRALEIRDLAKFINNEDALFVMEETGSVSQGLLDSGEIEKSNYKKDIKYIKSSISNLYRFKDLIQKDDINELRDIKNNFTEILPKTSSLDIQTDDIHTCFEKGKIRHFSSLNIENYKIFKNFKIDKLNKINIFAGFNNSGKTTLLEAVYLLTKQNHIAAFFEIVKLKNKLNKLNPLYLNKVINHDIRISGNFNDSEVGVEINKFEAEDINKKDDYIVSYKINSNIDDNSLESIVHTYENNPLERYYKKIEVLCSSIFKSPYIYNQSEIFNTHSKNVELKTIDEIIEFMKKIDSNIDGIELTEEYDIKRFLVDSKQFPEYSVDITSYGEGIQRIFEIALSFASVKNGILLIDELETAIHKSLLIDFTRFIQELADKFSVQVFITSHSKECIDAFVKNDYKNGDISAFLLKNIDGNIDYQFIKGPRLEYLIENIDLDIRGDIDE